MFSIIIETYKSHPTEFIAFCSLIIALIGLYLSIKNRVLQKKFYTLTLDSKRRNDSEFIHIISEQLEDSFINKLVVYNPSSQGIILQSLRVYKENIVKFPLLQQLRILPKWISIDAVWWPTSKEDDYEIKYLEDEYHNLYVEDMRVILVSISGIREKSKYKFVLKTSHDVYCRIQTITGFNTSFSYEFVRKYKQS